jgi:acyl-CoA dehydrogenase family protein 9
MKEEEKRFAEELLFSEKHLPSFAKQLFFGKFEKSLVFPYPHLPFKESESKFLEQIKAFANAQIDPVRIDKEAKIPDEVIKGLSSLGVLGMTVPKEFGGLAMSQNAYCRTIETLARRCGSTALFVSVHQSIGLKALLLYGTEEQKRQWLPSLARGDILAAFSLTEPNAGSDANGIETKAVFDPKKNVYRLNGLKQWTTNGSIAGVLTVMAKTEVKTNLGIKEQVTAFLVTPDMPGFKVRDRSLEKTGFRGTWTANLAFNDMEVPAANILGPIGGGLKVCLTVLDYGRTTFGAACTGVAKELEERAIHHAFTRHQFNRPLASFALVKKKIALISSLTYAMEATTYLTAGLIDHNVEDIMLESAMLKVFTSEALWKIIYETMQIMGGRSFFTNEPYERLMRDARLNMIGEGSNEVMRAFIGAVGMRDVGMEMKSFTDALKNPFSEYKALFKNSKSLVKKLRSPSISINSALLKEEGALLSKGIRRFSWSIMKLLSQYRENIIENQLQLNRIASSAISIYTTTAVLGKLDAELVQGNLPANVIRNQLAIGKFYCRYAMGELNKHLDGISKNNDIAIEALSDQITGFINEP